METKIIKRTKNPFMDREELLVEISSISAPSIQSIKDSIDKGNDLVVVKKVHSNFGKRKFTADVFAYASKESKDRTETLSRKNRDKIKEDKKASAEAAKKAKADAKSSEAPSN